MPFANAHGVLPAWAVAALLSVVVLMTSGEAIGENLPRKDIDKLFNAAEARGRVAFARKTSVVDARPAEPGEIIETVIATVTDGKESLEKETRSKPAQTGDMVIRNRCPQTGNEQYLVPAKIFAERYQGPIGAVEGKGGWREYRPTAQDMKYFIVGHDEGDFVFVAPWGEDMIARVGDAIVRSPDDPINTYRVARISFECTYQMDLLPDK